MTLDDRFRAALKLVAAEFPGHSPREKASIAIDRHPALFDELLTHLVANLIEEIMRREPGLTERQIMRRVKQRMLADIAAGGENDFCLHNRGCSATLRSGRNPERRPK